MLGGFALLNALAKHSVIDPITLDMVSDYASFKHRDCPYRPDHFVTPGMQGPSLGNGAPSRTISSLSFVCVFQCGPDGGVEVGARVGVGLLHVWRSRRDRRRCTYLCTQPCHAMCQTHIVTSRHLYNYLVD
jgi:hypothetical protein